MAQRHKLTTKQEQFAQMVAKGSTYTDAYVSVYDTKTARQNAGVQASGVANHPGVSARIDELRKEMAREAVLDGAGLIRQLIEIAIADPNELMQHRRVACRYCNGIHHLFQWKHPGEFAKAVDDWTEERDAFVKRFPGKKFKKKPPDDTGGYGYKRNGDVHTECPSCDGEGIDDVFIQDTRLLSGPAKSLYAGVKRTKNGVEILTHSQDGARKMLGEHWGLFRTILEGKLSTTNTNVNANVDYSQLSNAALKELHAAMKSK